MDVLKSLEKTLLKVLTLKILPLETELNTSFVSSEKRLLNVPSAPPMLFLSQLFRIFEEWMVLFEASLLCSWYTINFYTYAYLMKKSSWIHETTPKLVNLKTLSMIHMTLLVRLCLDTKMDISSGTSAVLWDHWFYSRFKFVKVWVYLVIRK